MSGRSAAQLSRRPAEWKDRQAEERRQNLAALLRELEAARHHAAPWYRWIEWRQRGEHRHELRDEQGRQVACPVAGCDALKGSENPHLFDGGRSRRRSQPAGLA